MRSVSKRKGLHVKKQNMELNLQGAEVVELAKVGAKVVESGFSWLNEIEKTRQIAIEAEVAMKESDNRLASELASIQRDMLQIQKEFALESKRLDNELTLKLSQHQMIKELLDSLVYMRKQIELYQEKEGLDSPVVLKLLEQLHQQQLTYTNMLQIG
jgi:hypothetical protein